MTGPVVRIRIDFGEYLSLGPGKIRLLEAIRASGSLSQAAREMGMSYRRAWLLVESLKQTFKEPVTVSSTGGKEGGGMRVTEFGEGLISRYRHLEREVTKLAGRSFRTIMPMLGRPPGSGIRTSLRARLE